MTKLLITLFLSFSSICFSGGKSLLLQPEFADMRTAITIDDADGSFKTGSQRNYANPRPSNNVASRLGTFFSRNKSSKSPSDKYLKEPLFEQDQKPSNYKEISEIEQKIAETKMRLEDEERDINQEILDALREYTFAQQRGEDEKDALDRYNKLKKIKEDDLTNQRKEFYQWAQGMLEREARLKREVKERAKAQMPRGKSLSIYRSVD